MAGLIGFGVSMPDPATLGDVALLVGRILLWWTLVSIGAGAVWGLVVPRLRRRNGPHTNSG